MILRISDKACSTASASEMPINDRRWVCHADADGNLVIDRGDPKGAVISGLRDGNPECTRLKAMFVLQEFSTLLPLPPRRFAPG
jgi:hypothetical protein